MDSVGYVSDRDLVLRPSRKQWKKRRRLTFPCKRLTPFTAPLPRIARYAMLKLSDESAGFWRPRASKFVKRQCRASFGISAEVLLDQRGSKTVKTRGHRRVGGEEIARSCDRQRHFEGLPCLFHEIAGTLQDGERRVPFVQVTNLRLNPERAEQSPSADPEQQFLLQAQFRPAPVELAGNSSMSGKVRRVIAVQQVKLHPADLDLPGAQPDRVSRQRDLQP